MLFRSGQLLGRERLDSAGPLRGIELAEGTFHSLVALTPNAVMFELKQGPYVPASDKDFLAGFPLEGTSEASRLERDWRALFTADLDPQEPSSPSDPPGMRAGASLERP